MSPPHLLTLRQEHTGPITGCLKRFVETRTSSGTNLLVCSAVLEAFGTVWTMSGQIQLAKSESVGRLDAIRYSDCSMTILIGGVLVNQMGRSDDGLHSNLSFPVFMFWIMDRRLAPPDVKETYCISCRRRTFTLLCSWQQTRK